jgi:phage baseplate assembly protein W
MATIQDRKVYDFSSVGTKTIDFRKNVLERSNPRPIGILTPISLGYGQSGLLKMSRDLVTQVRDNFRNMLSTNWGDRLVLYDFGANLEELAFELTSEGVELEAIARIKRTTEKYMPFITLHTYQTFNEPSKMQRGGMANVGVRVTYSIQNFGPTTYTDEVIIHCAG